MNSAQAVSIFLNDQPHELDGPATLLRLLEAQGLAGRKGVAAAVNGDVVPRASWETRLLAERDHVLVIRATQGG
ncbi:MAG TPA: sulfur carrier protein ThiS [Opitutaceae bacterium]|jgi:sulfur carrier protein|nr:sulfur carrier protein ThiS [Opitutaceae bacterium]